MQKTRTNFQHRSTECLFVAAYEKQAQMSTLKRFECLVVSTSQPQILEKIEMNTSKMMIM